MPEGTITNGDATVDGTDPRQGTLDAAGNLDFGFMKVEASDGQGHDAINEDEPLFGAHIHEAYQVLRAWMR